MALKWRHKQRVVRSETQSKMWPRLLTGRCRSDAPNQIFTSGGMRGLVRFTLLSILKKFLHVDHEIIPQFMRIGPCFSPPHASIEPTCTFVLGNNAQPPGSVAVFLDFRFEDCQQRTTDFLASEFPQHPKIFDVIGICEANANYLLLNRGNPTSCPWQRWTCPGFVERLGVGSV